MFNFSNFSLCGNIPVLSIWLMMTVIGVASRGFKNFKSFREISSKPQLVLDDKLSMILLTSLTFICSK